MSGYVFDNTASGLAAGDALRLTRLLLPLNSSVPASGQMITPEVLTSRNELERDH